eukprot:scaffold459_cov117-Isochrysis_galbana.AAC.10
MVQPVAANSQANGVSHVARALKLIAVSSRHPHWSQEPSSSTAVRSKFPASGRVQPSRGRRHPAGRRLAGDDSHIR